MSENVVQYTAVPSALGEVTITPEQVDLIKSTVAIGATNDELKLFFFECRRRGVHPLDRLIHFVKRSGKATFQCGIDFMRSQAEASGEYRGQEDIEFGPIANGYPEWAKATVRRLDSKTGTIYTVSSSAYWDEFYPGDSLGFMWKKMPRVMLGKVAESQALRKAFPLNFNGLYSFEEMQVEDIVHAGTAKKEMKPPQSKSAPANGQEKESPVIKDPEAPASEKQVQAISTMLSKLGIPDSTRHDYVSYILDVKVESLKNINKGQASLLIDKLNTALEEKKTAGNE